MAKLLVLTFSIFSIISVFAAEGIGGIIGGSGGRTWNDEMRSRRSYIAWPEIKPENSPRSYKLHELCIKDDNTMATKFTRKKYKLSIKKWKIKRHIVKEWRVEMDRVFNSKKNCEISSYFNCQVLDSYVQEEVRVPVYKGYVERDGEGNEFSLLTSRRPKYIGTYKVPHCPTK